MESPRKTTSDRASLPSSPRSPRKQTAQPISTSQRKLQARSLMTPPLGAMTQPLTKSSSPIRAPPSAPSASLVALTSGGQRTSPEEVSEEDKDVPREETRNRGAGDYIRLPLEYLTKQEIKEAILQEGKVDYGFDADEEDKIEEEEEDQVDTIIGPDRARFNVWKGINYELHVLGNFKSEFEKKVKSFQRPRTRPISLDPFCREESGLKEEPPQGEAFLVWETKSKNWPYYEESESKISIVAEDQSSEDSSQEYELDSCASVTSVTDLKMKEYIQSQKEKKRQGLDLTGETIYYDDEFGVIRNLHRDSVSLTNYGTMPDDKFLGKAHIFYPELTQEERKMLQPVDISTGESCDGKKGVVKKKSTKTITQTPRSRLVSLEGKPGQNFELGDSVTE